MREIDTTEIQSVNGGIGLLANFVYGLAGAALFKSAVNVGERNAGDPGVSLGTVGA